MPLPAMTDLDAIAWARRQQWKFSGYYKYSFSFSADDGNGLEALITEVGGSSEDIYRFDVSSTDNKFWDIVARGCEYGSLTIREKANPDNEVANLSFDNLSTEAWMLASHRFAPLSNPPKED